MGIYLNKVRNLFQQLTEDEAVDHNHRRWIQVPTFLRTPYK